MENLFFDIECANCFGGNGKICSFGYVLTDDAFNVLEKEDILVNPRSRFHLTNRKGASDIVLAYSVEEFKRNPDFGTLYDRIKGLLMAPERRIFGHSVINDINFLLSDCKRYSREPFEMTCFDSQILYRFLTKGQTDAGLGKICEIYGIDPMYGDDAEAQVHRSDNDALLTMSVIKRMCSDNNTDIVGLLELCPNASYTVSGGRSVNNFSTVSRSKKLAELAKHTPRRKERIVEAAREKVFGFSHAFEEDNYKQAYYLVKKLRNAGGKYGVRAGRCDYFLDWGEEGDASQRTQSARISSEECGKPILLDEYAFIALLEIDRNEYDNVQNLSLSALRRM